MVETCATDTSNIAYPCLQWIGSNFLLLDVHAHWPSDFVCLSLCHAAVLFQYGCTNISTQWTWKSDTKDYSPTQIHPTTVPDTCRI